MRRLDRRVPYVVALAAGALVVSACSSGGGGGGGGGDGKSDGPGEDKTVSSNYSIGGAVDAAGPAP
ncbi:ABC transporter substrate-binding protein, partial [Streptomyces sp. SCA2-4]|nr:ABC transporter substrate-binding protein [Streptomyces huiliensis]